MLSFRDVESILSRVTYKDWWFEVNPLGLISGDIVVAVYGRFPERETWINPGRQGDKAKVTQTLYVYPYYSPDDFIEALFRACLDLEYHEAAESFYVDRVRVKDPHEKYVKAADNA